MDSRGSEQGPETLVCEHISEPRGSLNAENFLSCTVTGPWYWYPQLSLRRVMP
jgi:hypothetical protein